VRWVRPEGIHLTLKFFGNVPEEKIPLLAQAASSVAQKFGAFRLRLAGLGAFPSERRPRVVWTGLQGDIKELTRLQQQLEEAFVPLGFPPEGRPFVPHVTLGRVKSNRGLAKLRHLIEVNRKSVGQGWEEIRVDYLILYKSTLKPSGAVYTPLKIIPLGRNNVAQSAASE